MHRLHWDTQRWHLDTVCRLCMTPPTHSSPLQPHDTRQHRTDQPASCSTQRTIIVFNKFRASHSVYNSWQHRRCNDGLYGLQQLSSDAKSSKRRINMSTYFVCETIMSPQAMSPLAEDLNAVTESPMPYHIVLNCSMVTMGLSCVVFDIWPWDRQRMDGKRTDRHRLPLQGS